MKNLQTVQSCTIQNSNNNVRCKEKCVARKHSVFLWRQTGELQFIKYTKCKDSQFSDDQKKLFSIYMWSEIGEQFKWRIKAMSKHNSVKKTIERDFLHKVQGFRGVLITGCIVWCKRFLLFVGVFYMCRLVYNQVCILLDYILWKLELF